jgi:protein TonB
MPHVEVLDERDSMKRPLWGSIILHVSLFAGLTVATYAEFGKREPWGDPNALGGGAVGVTAVKSIPLPGRDAPINRVANDTQSQVPEPVTKAAKQTVKEDPDAIALKSKKSKAQLQREAERYKNPRKELPKYSDNQVTSTAGRAAASPLFSMAPGSGGVGVGTGAPFGTRFGAYAALIQDRVAQKWRTDQVDARVRAAPPAIVLFEITRTGQVGRVKLMQSSGNTALDYSAQRAITEASPFPALPAAYDGNTAMIEFWFQLKR